MDTRTLITFGVPLGLALLVVLVAYLFGVYLPRQRRIRARQQPPSLVPFAPSATIIPPRPSRARVPHEPPIAQPVAPPVQQVQPRPATYEVPAQGLAQMGGAGAAVRTEFPPLRLEVGGAAETPVTIPEARIPTLRVQKDSAVDGTLQFLPGRMEIIDGRDIGHEIRFVKTPGPDGTSLTFGRAEGIPYRHVQLHEPTVSRHHARMTLDGKQWKMTNLSKTNPVVINGAPMDGEGDTVVLNDGDRVEMGEVVFKFHAK